MLAKVEETAECASRPYLNKPSAKRATLEVAKRIVYPRHTVELLKCFRKQPPLAKAADDAQLKLYAEILPGDFLNYGYFDDPDVPPEQLSLHDIQQAQIRYGQLLIDQIRNRSAPVLDAGCGMGGLLNLLVEQGFSATALTPNLAQAQYVRARHPAMPLVHGTFESIAPEKYRHAFGTVITAESFQYMKLSPALAAMCRILAPGGRWILSDYFRTSDSRTSGHLWSDFDRALQAGGWRITLQRDITQNALPTIAYIYMWGKRLGIPVAAYALAKLRRKRPAVHYLFEELLDQFQGYLLDQLELVNPEVFAREKKYMLLVIERSVER